MHRTIRERTIGFVSRQHRAFKINIVKNMIVSFSGGLTQQYQSIYIYSLGATALELGYVNSIGGVANTILSVPVGLLADRHGIKKMMVISLLLMALGYAIFGGASNWQTIALALISVSVANLVQMNVCPMICGSCLRSVERTIGMQICDTLAAVPRLFAPVMAAFAIASYGGLNSEGIRPLFWFEFAGIIIALIIFWRYFSNPPGTGESSGASFKSGVGRVTSEGVHVKRWIAYHMLMNLPWTMGFYIPLYARILRGASPLVLGLMDSGYWLASVVLALPVGLASDRLGRKGVIAALSPLYGLGLMIMIQIPGDYALLTAGALNGFTMLMGVTEGSIAVELVPKDLLGAWFGLLGLFSSVVGFVAPMLGGILWDGLGPNSVLYFLAATQVAKLGILSTMPSKPKYS